MDVLIKNGNIVDGTLEKPFMGDIYVKDGMIQAIGKDIHVEGIKVVDARGRVVAPGFIDTHSHSDLIMLLNPYNEVKIRQGVTTEVLGQDGISMAPLPVEYISPWRKNLAGLDGDSDEINWEYRTTENYLNMMAEKGVGLNEAYLVPHGNIRMEAMGLSGEVATDEQIAKMCKITRREMEAGAYGLSTGLIYMPCAYSETKEV
ncbi:amidohydrolase family protein, partial [Ilyobacter sp.]|uniref:amidohydrolase family protein n=1 Tax=Ilyobacter sp. TaxID=3100343 RepID=UPI003566CA53